MPESLNQRPATAPDPVEAHADKSVPMSFPDLEGAPDCPPAGSTPSAGVFYICHEANPPGPTDFLTAAQRGKFPKANECHRRSQSLCKDLVDAESLLERYMFFNHISKADLKPIDGVIEHTPSRTSASHHDFWVCAGKSVRTLFKEVVK